MIVKMIYCPYQDSTRDTRSNIPLRLQEFPRASPSGTPSGEGVYLTVYPSSRPNTDTVYSTLYSILYSAVFNEIYARGVSMDSLGCNQPTTEDQTCKIQPCIAETRIYHYHHFAFQSGLARFAFVAKIGGYFQYSVMPNYQDGLQECTKEAQVAGTARLWNHSFIYKGNFSHH